MFMHHRYKMDNETKRVGYVFRADTVEMLRQLGEIKEPVMFEGRTATWLVEFAIP